MPKHNWQSHILSGSLIHFLGGYLHAKIKEIYPLLSEILMIKESCNLTAREHFGLQLDSHKKQKSLRKTLLFWNLPHGPKHRGSFLKNMACSERNQLLVADFRAVLDKLEADILIYYKITKEPRMNHLGLKIILQKDCSFFFLIWVFFHEHSRFTGQQGKGEAISLSPLYHFHPFHRY